MTFYQELQLSSTGSKQLIKNTTDKKEKRRHILIYNFKVYLVMVFCVAVVSLYSKFIGNDNSVVGVTVLLAVLVLRQADFGIRTTHGLASIAGIYAILMAGNSTMSYNKRGNESFYESLENKERLQDLEDFLNAMGIECKLDLQKLPDGTRELYFAHNKLISFFENASSGTLALVNLYRRLIARAWDASFIYLDEFDAFYHYEMADQVIRFFKRRYPKCQMIMTSHNTNLMTNRLMRPDCLFILSREGNLTALCNATQRELREGHNLEKMYISGEFEKYE